MKEWISIRDTPKERYRQRKFFLDGRNAIRDLAQKVRPSVIIATDKDDRDFLSIDAESKAIVTPSQLKTISAHDNPDGIASIFPFPDWVPKSRWKTAEDSTGTDISVLDGKKLILAINCIQDPGNLGNLFRTAACLRWDGVLLVSQRWRIDADLLSWRAAVIRSILRL